MKVIAYVDGARLNAKHDLGGLCASLGWAVAASDCDDNLVVAANGQIPDWLEGIHATELWGVLMALETFDPGCPIKVHCKALQLGALRSESWANAPCKTFARAWGPVAQPSNGYHSALPTWCGTTWLTTQPREWCARALCRNAN